MLANLSTEEQFAYAKKLFLNQNTGAVVVPQSEERMFRVQMTSKVPDPFNYR